MDSILVELFRHHLWANARLLGACVDLSDAQLDASVEGTRGSIRETLLHLVAAEVRYVGLLRGERPDQAWLGAGWPGVAALREHNQGTGAALIQIAAEMPADKILRATYQGQERIMPAATVLIQAINHATEHRGQVATILTQQGVTPPDMSGWAYGEARKTN